MWKILLKILGVFIIINESISTILKVYLNINFPNTLIILSSLLLVIIFKILYSREKIITINKKFFNYSFSLFIMMLVMSVMFTSIKISIYQNELYLRVIYPFIIMIVFYLVIYYLDFYNFIKTCFLINMLNSIIIIFIQKISNETGRPPSALATSDMLAFLGILLFSIEKNKNKKIIIVIINTIVLVIYSSFTSVVIYAVVISFSIVYNLFVNSHFKGKVFIIWSIVVGILIMFYIYITLKNKEILINGDGYIINRINIILSRAHSVLNNRDPSQIERNKQLEEGLKIIKNNLFTGEFLYEVRIFGSTGAYIHNWLSFMAEFGLLVFVMIFGQYFRFMYKNYRLFKKNNDTKALALFLSSMYVLIIYMFSRSYASILLWISMAMMIVYVYKQKTKEISEKTKANNFKKQVD